MVLQKVSEEIDTVDPMTLAVIDGQLTQIVEEMDLVVVQTAFSPIISEGFDRACGLYEFSTGDLITQGESCLPIFVGTMEQTIKSVLDAGVEFAEGVVIITNDPYLGGTHLPDVRIIEALYSDGHPVLVLGVTAHWSDVGAINRVVSTSIHEEGIRIPPTVISRDGVIEEDVLELLLHNSRLRRDVLGDFAAQMAALNVGSLRVKELIEEFGLTTLHSSVAELRTRSEQMMRSRIRDLPDGDYHFVDHVDSDSVSDTPIKIELSVVVADDEITFDFSGSSPACVGPINMSRGATIASCNAALRHVFPDIPLNAGCFRPLSYRIEENSILDARYPSAVYSFYETACRIGDVVFGALFDAMQDKMFGASVSTAGAFLFAYERDGKYSGGMVLQPGGYGAYCDQDGLSGGNPPMSMAASTAIEILEHRAPIRFVEYGLRPDSAGAGQFRGGFGAITESRR